MEVALVRVFALLKKMVPKSCLKLDDNHTKILLQLEVFYV